MLRTQALKSLLKPKNVSTSTLPQSSLIKKQIHLASTLIRNSSSKLIKQQTRTNTNTKRNYSQLVNLAFKNGSSSSSSSAQDFTWARSLMALLAGGLSYLLLDNKEFLQSCGIIAFVGEEPAVQYLLEGLTILQNRGYDSAGTTTYNKDSGELVTTKFASLGSTSDSIDLLKAAAPKNHGFDNSGVAHTRWATHGGKTDANAHPHLDYKSRIALVHNGTIENSHELKEELEQLGIKFKSQTDTEVIAQLIGHYLDENISLVDAVKKALARLEGTWGLAILHKDTPGQIIAARNGSPLVIGLGQKKMFVASELSAFSRHTSQYISLNDGEVAVVSASGMNLDLSRVQKAPHENIQLSPDPFPHWTLKEIMEQPEAMSRTLGYGARFDGEGNVKLGGMQDNKDRLLPIRHLVFAACGTSLFASMYGAALFRSLKIFDTIQTVDAAEITAESFPPAEGGVCVVTQSGETKDTHRALVLAQDSLLPAFSIVNQVGSLIARTTNCGVYLNAGREHAVASTKAFTTQVTAMALIAGWYAQNRGKGKSKEDKTNSLKRQELMESIHRLPIYSGITLRTHDQCKKIAEKLYEAEHMFILGKGYCEAIAKEGALKVKEITYMHAEGFSGGALKHGPFALLEPGTPVVLLIMDDQHQELMRVAGAEVLARGANTVVITDKKILAKDIATEENTIVVPTNGPLSALLGCIPLQLLAYELAVKRGINPDKPKNLAKAVTVD